MRSVNTCITELYSSVMDKEQVEIINESECNRDDLFHDKHPAICGAVHISFPGNKGTYADKMGMTRIVTPM